MTSGARRWCPVAGEPRIGATLTCTGPAWSPADTAVRYRFVSYRYREGTGVVQGGALPRGTWSRPPTPGA